MRIQSMTAELETTDCVLIRGSSPITWWLPQERTSRYFQTLFDAHSVFLPVLLSVYIGLLQVGYMYVGYVSSALRTSFRRAKRTCAPEHLRRHGPPQSKPSSSPFFIPSAQVLVADDSHTDSLHLVCASATAISAIGRFSRHSTFRRANPV